MRSGARDAQKHVCAKMMAECGMPRKIRQLEADLREEGFTRQSGKGSHRRWVHPLYPGHVAISGNEGDDAKPS